MRYAIAGLSMLLGSLSVATPAMAQVSVSVSIPGVSIGIHQPVYPDLVLVPGSPVYYAPQVQANYFFYDGLYWVFQDDNWYVSSWYNGPWDLVEPDDVPLFVLRVPVQYYLRPPVFFHTWIVTAPPRWHYHWGPRWTRYHHGWDHWDRHAIPAPAPLPVYQRHYHGDRYPRREYQRVIRHEHYHYQSRDRIVRRHDQQRAAPRPQVHAQPHNRPAQPHNPDTRREQRSQRDREEAQRPQRDREQERRSEPLQALPQQRAQQQQQPPRQVQAPVQLSPIQQAPQGRLDTPRPQREQREREQIQRTEARQLLPQQRAAIQAQRVQPQPQPQRAQPQPQRAQPQPRQTTEQRAQAPRPQQAQGREQQNRADRQSRGNAERRQGQERGGDRGPGRG